ncbi:MAG: ABC transporter permease [Ruminococcus sp.]|nr:ABC transporter permease [Ruminococcus sp.]
MMCRLIRANFSRLLRSGVFRLYTAFSGGLGLFVVLMRYIDWQKNKQRYIELDLPVEFHTIDGIAFVGMLYLLFAVPVFVGIFLGTEYSDGTIRNKLVVGHKRSDIYLANLITCASGTLIGAGLNLLINFTLGTALCGLEVLTVSEITKITLFTFISLVSTTAVMVLVAMVVNSKAGASVSVIIITMIMFFTTITLANKLEQPEYYEDMAYYNTETQQMEITEHEKNPNYIEGTKRKVYQTVYDVMPTSHIYEYAMLSDEKTGKYTVYDCIILTVTTALGILIFRRKDLK